jgi:uncharacterized repeat protein (TIGR01451 family)
LGTFTNTATVTLNETDANPANNTATATTTVFRPNADVALAIAHAPEPVTAGGTLTYTLTVTNGGPDAIDVASVSDTLPPTVTFVSMSLGCSQAGPLVLCSTGPLASGAKATFQIVVTANTPGVVTNSASVSAFGTTDPNPANNSATDTAPVE